MWQRFSEPGQRGTNSNTRALIKVEPVSKQVNDVAARMHTWHRLHELPPPTHPKRVSQRIGPFLLFYSTLFTTPVVGTSIAEKPKNTGKYQQTFRAARGSHGAGVGILLAPLLALRSCFGAHPPPLSHRPLAPLGKGQTLDQGKNYTK